MPPELAESPEFDRLARGDERADLTVIALELARDAEPALEPGPYLDRIDALADRVRPRLAAGATADDILRQVNWVLYVEERFSGNRDDYFDPKNSYLNEVMDRRTGIPISLAVLYRAVAARAGLAMSGVSLPAHFVLRADRDGGDPVFVDAFDGGALLDREGCRRLVASRAGGPVELREGQFLPCPTSEVVSRMLRNLRAIYLDRGDVASAWPVLRRLVALRPGEPEHRRDLGVAGLSLDRPAEAIAQLSAYLEQAPAAGDAAAIRAVLGETRRRLGPAG